MRQIKLFYNNKMQSISDAGVLIVDGKTYGRYKNKLLYKCIPYDAQLAPILVPYEEKTNTFSKLKVNKYITFQMNEINPSLGTITNILGDVDELEAYTQYQLLAKGLNSSLKDFNSRALHENGLKQPLLSRIMVEDRRTRSILSIDPEGCTDIDDAIGLYKGKEGAVETILSIYIANVPLVLEHLKLWSVMSERIATIYLGTKKIPMLPPILSEDQCSLKEGEERLAFALDVRINANDNSILTYSCHTVLIKVEKNYTYEANDLLTRSDYQALLQCGRNLNKTLGYVDQLNDSHELIEFCMILMNYECSKLLLAKQRGIFRSATKKEDTITDCAIVPPDCKYLVQSVAGEYCGVRVVKPHELMASSGLPSYVHITSPIRRLVDCLNMLELQRDIFMPSIDAHQFLKKWLDKIPFINEKNKAIRKLQNEVTLLQLYQKNHQQIYRGFVFGRTITANFFKYKVYLPAIKLLTTVYSPKEVNNYIFADFTVHWFLDEIKMSKKIRLQML
jgi:exoribonuclease R